MILGQASMVEVMDVAFEARRFEMVDLFDAVGGDGKEV